jgi:hypothetical protein
MSEHLLLSRWFLGVVVLAEAAIVVWAWLTDRGSVTEFPAALITAEGVVLTATVFILGFSRERLRRNVGDILARMRARQTAVVNAYDNGAGRFPGMWLYEAAQGQSAEAIGSRALGRESVRDLIHANRRRRSLPERQDELERLSLDYYRLVVGRVRGLVRVAPPCLPAPLRHGDPGAARRGVRRMGRRRMEQCGRLDAGGVHRRRSCLRVGRAWRPDVRESTIRRGNRGAAAGRPPRSREVRGRKAQRSRQPPG